MESNRQIIRKKVMEVLTAAHDNLTSPSTLAEDLKVSAGVIYSAIRHIREGDTKNKPVGVHTIRGGYILSAHANVRQDVAFMRRLNGMRTGAYVMARAAAPHIQKRWGSVEDKTHYTMVMNPILVQGKALAAGMKVLTAKAKALNI